MVNICCINVSYGLGRIKVLKCYIDNQFDEWNNHSSPYKSQLNVSCPVIMY
jgi:hypothetical protein